MPFLRSALASVAIWSLARGAALPQRARSEVATFYDCDPQGAGGCFFKCPMLSQTADAASTTASTDVDPSEKLLVDAARDILMQLCSDTKPEAAIELRALLNATSSVQATPTLLEAATDPGITSSVQATPTLLEGYFDPPADPSPTSTVQATPTALKAYFDLPADPSPTSTVQATPTALKAYFDLPADPSPTSTVQATPYF